MDPKPTKPPVDERQVYQRERQGEREHRAARRPSGVESQRCGGGRRILRKKVGGV
jgi:hypothetical protein